VSQEVISRICRWCNAEAHPSRNLAGPGWICDQCLRSQDVAPCPCCGREVPVATIEAGLKRLEVKT
jgi:hypothetical protein